MRLLLLWVFLYLVRAIQAALEPTTNTTNTTTSNRFRAPSFTTRTLWTIISSSVFTLFACTYSAIHPNILSSKDGPLCIQLRRLGIMITALITPELIVTRAMRQWFSACLVTRQFQESGHFKISQLQEQSENHEPTEAPEQRGNCFCHLLVVLTKGVQSVLVFLWRFPGGLARSVKRFVRDNVSEQPEDYTWTQTHSIFVLMGGFMLYVDGKPCFTLRPDDILNLIRDGCVDVPTLTANQIQDRSKGNAISKGSTILQVAWFVVQLTTRAIYHLESTQLEVGTLAFAVLNFVIYTVWWNKPLNVQCPHPVHWKSTKSRPKEHIEYVCSSTIIPLLIMSTLVSINKTISVGLGFWLQFSVQF
ncbi:uncharacterized protein BJ212DRAFT_350281 [Suillus subaureus]|uniref:Uncharacterized protein n=1 Tax=Suillus subaureus TaxID=48587 RepID=A0A9P7E9L0_9AGAM|nr:uncharacterized protein BJ212DRAFT_350281 [Suillus subaureus]KAG1814746.1 hypothetical protein BJ212DRAFT_350281 [Suillus subaureus]